MFSLLAKCSVLFSISVILFHITEGSSSRNHPGGTITEPDLTEIRNLLLQSQLNLYKVQRRIDHISEDAGGLSLTSSAEESLPLSGSVDESLSALEPLSAANKRMALVSGGSRFARRKGSGRPVSVQTERKSSKCSFWKILC
ncbi:uncharacterized protein [Apostichopus japonicus]|uniref:uncharacterized protein isoform X1 n=1 Tax=Stichopus japonicus TaxID=307972 RepID=UPI003AB3DDC6